jgi:hypothetical protein
MDMTGELLTNDLSASRPSRELVVVRTGEDRQAKVYEWFWWAANFAAPVEPGAGLRRVTLLVWQLGIAQHKLAIRVFCYSVLIGQYRFLPNYYDKCAWYLYLIDEREIWNPFLSSRCIITPFSWPRMSLRTCITD